MNTPLLDILITINNYSHDIATAVLIVSGLLMFILYKGRHIFIRNNDKKLFSQVYKRIKYLAEGSLIWIIIAGIPRTVFYKQYEWSDLSGNLQIVAIIIKHIVMFVLVGMLSYYWIKLSKINKI